MQLDWKRDNILGQKQSTIFCDFICMPLFYMYYLFSLSTRDEERNRSGSFFAPQSIFLNLAATLAKLMQRDASSGLRHSVTVVTT